MRKEVQRCARSFNFEEDFHIIGCSVLNSRICKVIFVQLDGGQDYFLVDSESDILLK